APRMISAPKPEPRSTGAVSGHSFIRKLIAGGLVSRQDVNACFGKLSAGKQPKNARQAESLLLQAEKITAYQAKVIRNGRMESLIVGDYLVLDKIGAGGMGDVFKARCRKTGRVVALKVTYSGTDRDPE